MSDGNHRPPAQPPKPPLAAPAPAAEHEAGEALKGEIAAVKSALALAAAKVSKCEPYTMGEAEAKTVVFELQRKLERLAAHYKQLQADHTAAQEKLVSPARRSGGGGAQCVPRLGPISARARQD